MNPPPKSAITAWLERAPLPVLTAYGVVASFSAYFCMYGFRKPFAAAKYAGSIALFGGVVLDLKALYVVAQVVGYFVSKVVGVKVVAEVSRERRALAIVSCVAVAEVGLLLFGLLPAPYRAVGMLVNGLPLGMIWGLVFGFLEGRRASDFLGAGLSASFIVASGFVKSTGVAVLSAGVPEAWMPAVTGLVFAPPFLLATWLLAKIPPPSAEDEAARAKRAPMGAKERRAFLVAHARVLVPLVAGYVVLTALRDFRDNYAREIWEALGFGGSPAVMTTTEIPVAFGALFAVAAMMFVRDNRRALLATHALLLFGAALVGASTVAFRLGLVGPLPWMIAVGLGLYMGYVPFNCVLFDRLVATTRTPATAGFLITLADACGYLGSTALLLTKSLAKPTLPWLPFFTWFAVVGAMVCVATFAVAATTVARASADADPK